MTNKNLTAWNDISKGELMNTIATIDSVSGNIATAGTIATASVVLPAGTGNTATTATISGSADQTVAITFVMPATAGTNGQVLATDGNGVLSFTPNGVQSITSESAALTITTGTTPTATLNAELTALGALAATGIISRTDAGTYANRTVVAGNSNNLVITNADGVAGNPTVELNQTINVTNVSASKLGLAFMTSAARDAIATPALGSVVFVSDDAGVSGALSIFTGAWQTVAVV